MPSKPKQTTADPDEYKRFLETAKQVEAEESEESFDRAFSTVAKPLKRDFVVQVGAAADSKKPVGRSPGDKR